MILRAGFFLICLASTGWAQDGQAPSVASPAEVAGTKGLSAKALKKLQRAPDAFMQDAASLIYGFGKEGGIDAAGIDLHIAALRARVRAAVIERYLAADMDNDGEIARVEMAALANAEAAGKRGALLLGFEEGDGDRNGVLSGVELRSYAQVATLKKLSDEDAEAIHGIIVFDLDADGVVKMEEVATGVTALLNDT